MSEMPQVGNKISTNAGLRVFGTPAAPEKTVRMLAIGLGVACVGLGLAVWAWNGQQAQAAKLSDERAQLLREKDDSNKSIAVMQARASNAEQEVETIKAKLSQVQSALELQRQQADQQRAQIDVASQQSGSAEVVRKRPDVEPAGILQLAPDSQAQLQQSAARAQQLENQLRQEKAARALAEKAQADLKKLNQNDEDKLKKDKVAADKSADLAKKAKDAAANESKQVKDLQDQLKREKDDLEKANLKIKALEAKNHQVKR